MATDTVLTVGVNSAGNLLFVSKIPAIAYCVILLILSVMVFSILISNRMAPKAILRLNPYSMAGQGMIFTGESDFAGLFGTHPSDLNSKEIKSIIRSHRWELRDGVVCVDRQEKISE